MEKYEWVTCHYYSNNFDVKTLKKLREWCEENLQGKWELLPTEPIYVYEKCFAHIYLERDEDLFLIRLRW